MGEGTLRLSNLKAEVGAELWLMKSALEEVGLIDEFATLMGSRLWEGVRTCGGGWREAWSDPPLLSR